MQKNEPGTMVFLSGFSWAVPVAFADAVARCQFVEGDTLYDARDAYTTPWGQQRDLRYWIQVDYPARAVGSTSDGSTGRFESNWTTAVRLTLFDKRQPGSSRLVHSTQGRLYTVLWRGQLATLESALDPLQPTGLRHVAASLQRSFKVANALNEHGLSFVMAHDHTNPTSNYKYGQLLQGLSSELVGEPKRIRPKEAGLPTPELIAPTVDIVAFRTTIRDEGLLSERVKKAVYAGTGAGKEVFRLAAHGMIV